MYLYIYIYIHILQQHPPRIESIFRLESAVERSSKCCSFKDVDRRLNEFDVAALAEVFEAHYMYLDKSTGRAKLQWPAKTVSVDGACYC